VIRTIALAPSGPLSFGVLAADAQPADVTVSPSGEVTASRPGVIVPSARSAGAFDVSGQANRVYLVDLPTSVNLTAGSQTMTVRNLALQFQGAPSTGGTGQLSAEGRQSFTVGGTLGLGASQAPGDYVGAYSVTARYQ
jgi:hypothetical protein